MLKPPQEDAVHRVLRLARELTAAQEDLERLLSADDEPVEGGRLRLIRGGADGLVVSA